ncbi:MAG: hypothetical protein GF401_02190 [Chitinivibrionales bacterium]|nr:hypothetical protein [Chitinivibrionales bacterium]
MKHTIILLMICTALGLPAHAGEAESTVVLQPEVSRYNYDAIPKDPLASAFFSASLPGTGQLYNREFFRGVITGSAFYTGLFTTYYMLSRWEKLNTDTFYVREYSETGDPTNIYHEATALKPDDEQGGLPTEEKVILGAALTLAASSYVFGIIDAYQGAQRFNEKLTFSNADRFDIKLGADPIGKTVVAAATFKF